jgi:Lipocalin-like domain
MSSGGSTEMDDRLLGTWELDSMSWNYPDGRKVEPWGKPAGRITYDADGNVLALLMHEQRNQADGKACDPETLPNYSAYFGTYRIDSASGVIRHQVAASLNIDASGELRRTFAFEDGKLILGFTAMRDSVPVTRRLVWRRISKPISA